MAFRGQILRGLGWAGALRVFVKLLSLAKLAVLARVLTPEAFGQFGIAVLALSFFETVTETGVNQVLIYSERKLKDLLDSAWIVSIVRGVAIAILIGLSAFPLSWYFHDAHVFPLVFLIAVAPFVRGFVNPMIVTFVKELDFRREFLFRSASAIVDVVAAVTIGILTHSPVAFVGAIVLSATTDVILSFVLFTIRPRFRFLKTYLSEIVGYGKWVTLTGIGSWFSSELDDMIVGRLYGVGALGIYQAGYKISTLPVTEIAGTVNQVSFPVLSKSRRDSRTFRRIFWSSFLISNAIGAGVASLLLLFPELLVRLLLGADWLPVIPVIRILALFGVLRTVESSVQPLLLSVGKPQVATIGNFLKVIGLVAGLMIWGRQGVEGVALAALLSVSLSIPYYMVTMVRILRP